jgi:CheY-like chemotaxis protein
MPQHDGFDFLKAVRTRSACTNVPVIAVTGHAPLRARALAAGFADFLTKPIDPEELCDRIGQIRL